MRLIDADAFSDFIKRAVFEQGYEVLRICDTLTVADVFHSVCAELDGTGLEGFKNAPTVDAVEVVRCKDCIRYRPDGNVWGRCMMAANPMRKKDFCSYGVRKDGGNETD